MINDAMVAFFEKHKPKTAINQETGEQVWSVVDVIAALTESDNPRKYWNKLKERIKKEAQQPDKAEMNEMVTNCLQLKMVAADGKKREAEMANLETIFRIIESVPSPKAEPYKQWFAKVAAERVEEEINPELAISRGRERAVKAYKRQGRSDEWITRRVRTIDRGADKKVLG